MQKPDERLDIVKPAPEVDSDAPSDEVSTPIGNTFLSWLRRSLAIASVLAIVILVFLSVLSAIFIAIERPAPRSDVTTSVRPGNELTQTEEAEETEETEEPLSFDS